MADGKPGQEPTMEEILTSIRRIIAEDEGVGEPPASPARGAPPADDGVLELTEIVSEGKPQPPRAAPPPAAAPSPPPPQASAPPQPMPPRQERPALPPVEATTSLISDEAAKASAAALARLARAGNAEERKPPPGAQATVEQFLAELLTPMLRDWLDRNLPQIVERVVEQEVKKLARRAELL